MPTSLVVIAKGEIDRDEVFAVPGRLDQIDHDLGRDAGDPRRLGVDGRRV